MHSILSLFFNLHPPPITTLFPYTTLFRSLVLIGGHVIGHGRLQLVADAQGVLDDHAIQLLDAAGDERSEEHTSELQSRGHLVCRLLLEKKKKLTCYKKILKDIK